MSHRVRRLCCAFAFSLAATFLTGSVSQAQLVTKSDANVMALDGDGDPIPSSMFTVRDSEGHVLLPSGENDGMLEFSNVGRKLVFEFASRGPKARPIELLLIDAPRVFISVRADPFTGHVKEIVQKPMTVDTGRTNKTRRFPGGGQQSLVPPSNDACATPLPVINGANAFTTVDATTDGIAPGCTGTANIHKDVWFDYIATGTGVATFETCSAATFDTKIAIYLGLGCPAGAPIGCNDDFSGCSGFTSKATASVTAGIHYLVRVGGFSSSTPAGTGTLTITPPAPPPVFDSCATAPTVVCGSSTMFNNSGGTTVASDPAFSCRFGGPGQGFGTSWFKFVAIGPSATIDTNGSLTGDTMLAVYSGTCGAFTELACDDDSGSGLLSMLTVTGLTVSTTYYIQVAGFGAGNVGANTLNVACAAGPPPGDDCADALMGACDSSVTVDLSTMSTDPTDPVYSCSFGGPAQGVGTAWITFVATDTSAKVSTNASTSASDTLLALYDGTCGSFVELCCSDDDGIGLLSEFCCEGLTPGNTYYIQVSSFDAFSLGEATVTIECPCPAPPANDECEDAIALGLPPASVTFDTTLSTDDIGMPCGVFSGPFSNVWYSVTGTGNTITATTCTAGTSHPDTKISVFCGECLAPVCVTGNDDDGSCGFDTFFSTVSWCSQPGVSYLVTVGGFAPGQVGVVELDVSDDGVPCDNGVQCLPVGACCLPDGSCVVVTGGDCAAADGTYQGDGTECDANAVVDGGFEAGLFSGNWAESSTNFGTPLCDGACGFGGGTGPNTGSFWAWFGGIPAFEEGAVEQLVTIPVTATTIDFFLEIPAASNNGTDFMEVTIDGSQIYLALESDGPYVGYLPVSVPLGAFADGGSHSVEFHSICTALTNFFVDDVSINSVSIPCPQPPGACCLVDGSCVEVTEEECDAMGGMFNGDGVTCMQVTCVQPDGACCLADGSCVELTEEECDDMGGMYNGDFSLCVDVTCEQPCHVLTLDDGGFSHGDSAESIVGPGSLVGVDGVSFNAANCNPGTPGTALVFNSDVGPFNQDPDLDVDSGNILILQTNEAASNPNDDEDGGTLTFSFSGGVEPMSIDLIDIDGSFFETVIVTLTDGSGDTRVYTVPANWTGDVLAAQPGIGTLFLNVTTPQAGPNAGSATAVTGANYDPLGVVSIVVYRGACGSGASGGSGGVDNLNWCE